MPELQPILTDAQIRASALYKEKEAQLEAYERREAEQRLGLWPDAPAIVVPDTTEVLTSPDGGITESMSFPYVMWTRRGPRGGKIKDGSLRRVEVNSLQEYWYWNGNTGYDILFGKGATLKHYSKTEGNPLSLVEWMLIDGQEGVYDGDMLGAIPEALHLEPTTAIDRTPDIPFEDPALVTFGDSQDVATIQAAHDGVDVDGVARGFAQNAIGDWVYREQVIITKRITLESSSTTRKVKLRQGQTANHRFLIQSACTITDFDSAGRSVAIGAFHITAATGTVRIERSIARSGQIGVFRASGEADVLLIAVLAYNQMTDGYTSVRGVGGSWISYNCLAHFSGRNGFLMATNEADALLINCEVYGTRLDDYAASGGGSYAVACSNNLSEDGTHPDGGGSGVDVSTRAEMAFAMDNSPAGSTINPEEFWTFDGLSSPKEGGGADLSGIFTKDYFGKTIVSWPIGPIAGLTTLGVPPVTRPVLPLTLEIEQVRELTLNVETT